MADNISAIGSAGSVLSDANKSDTLNPAVQSAKASPVEITGQQRLVIEPVSAHRFVYKVLDSKTGEVIRQLPNEHVEKMITDPAYQEGGLVKTSI